jgi:hypothetical protein
MLFVVDSHDFCLGFVYLEPGLLGFFFYSVELFLVVLVLVGQKGDVFSEIQVLQLFGEGPLDPCLSCCQLPHNPVDYYQEDCR